MSQKIVKTTCGMCHGGCGILAYVDDGRLVKVEGDKECPINKGAMCPMGLAATQLVYHPDRIKYPMKRAGKRGEGKWQRISWDEALDTVAARTKEIRDQDGPLSIVIGRGTGRPVGAHVQRFARVLGSVTYGPAHLCYTPMRTCGEVTYGKFPGPDNEHTGCIVNVGSGSTQSRGARMGRILMDAIKRGTKLISIDPYLHPLASKSTIWLQIRPGTDCAMALAWHNVIIKEGLYDKEFVQKWTYGFDKLAEHVERFTPEWAESITWVPAEKIRQAARLYATTKPAALHMGVSVEQNINTTNTIRSLLLLPAITGNVDIPGGNVLWQELVSSKMYYAQAKSMDYALGEGMGELLLSKHMFAMPNPIIWKTVLTGKPYKIRATLIHSSNPVMGEENARGEVYKGIMKLDFVSVMDLFMTPTAELADIVLPASSIFERNDVYQPVHKNYLPPTLCATSKVIEPLWESRDDVDVFIDILKRMGLDYGAKTAEENLDQTSMAAADMTFKEVQEKHWVTREQHFKKYEKGLLRRDGKPGFETPSGKIEIDSSELTGLGMNPMPTHKEPPESPYSSPALLKDYPLVLTTGIRSAVYFHTQYRQIPWLRKIHPDPIVRIHPETAASHGINEGDWIYIESPRGKCRQRALLTLGIDPRTVLAEHDWWFPEKPAPEHGCWDSNINLLTESDPPYRDPGLASTPVRSLLCKIYKVEV